MRKTNPNKKLKIGLIGCGNMGSSMVQGLIESSYYPQNVYVCDSDPKKIKEIKKFGNFRIAKTNRHLASICDVIILAVKPSNVESVLDEIALTVVKSTLVISIAAGVRIKSIEKQIKRKCPVIRVMPNMPALIGKGVSVYSAGQYVTKKHKTIAEHILTSIGEVIEERESKLDAVTAISGSGPAYIFLLAEKMIEAAHELGIKTTTAKQLVYQTALGSAHILRSNDEDPDVLIQKVASKGGTTEAALKVFRRKGFGKIVKDAASAACTRSKKISEEA